MFETRKAWNGLKEENGCNEKKNKRVAGKTATQGRRK